MTGRMILLALGLSLLPGCGRRDHPTVRQNSVRPEEESAATMASNPPQAAADATCPRPAIARRTRPKRDASIHSKLAGAMHSKEADVSPPEIAAANPAGTGDTTPAKAAGRDAAGVDGREVRIGGMRLVAPKTWTREQTPLAFIVAEFSLPRAQGDRSDAQLTVAPFGKNDPRSVARLREQIKQESEEGSVEHLQIGGNEVVLVDTSGVESDEEDGDTSGSSPPPASEGRYRVLNAMVFVGGKAYFVTCTGPEKTVGERAGEFRAFLQTMKAADES